MAKRRATEEALGILHEVVAKELTQLIKSGEAGPAHFSAAIKFLKDNGIEADTSKDSPVGKLLASLPTFDDEDGDHPLN